MTVRHRAALRLAGFVPFRLNRLAAEVSQHLSAIYRARFALEIPEWRVIATVGQDDGCTAQHVADSTRMHKTRVSRAIAHLVRRRLIERVASAHDRRERQLRLTRAGRRMYAQLVPLALRRERALLACLSGPQRRGFIRGLDRLEEFFGLRKPRAG
ncbi:MAG TPA: MarR family winged helix-turn-helix transcriptional regulator [Steroidobacteraceae bacterium]|nr:MarR family winged helix-turn-helix transcriptional regulator [Steroidobacteraceae bacterium]